MRALQHRRHYKPWWRMHGVLRRRRPPPRAPPEQLRACPKRGGHPAAGVPALGQRLAHQLPPLQRLAHVQQLLLLPLRGRAALGVRVPGLLPRRALLRALRGRAHHAAGALLRRRIRRLLLPRLRLGVTIARLQPQCSLLHALRSRHSVVGCSWESWLELNRFKQSTGEAGAGCKSTAAGMGLACRSACRSGYQT